MNEKIYFDSNGLFLGIYMEITGERFHEVLLKAQEATEIWTNELQVTQVPTHEWNNQGIIPRQDLKVKKFSIQIK